ncbi:MAG TPA: transglutaminase-like domain-containing protein [Anaerolineales bacterium]|jgi:transglutaminase-like putative cysteine protease|nr:transglutaminase-like domain-containing protein [Anaerolineales bacterium]
MEKLHVPQSRWWDWAAIGLLFVLLQTVASRLVATTWTPFLYLTQTFTYLGFVIGAALGYSTFQRRTVRWLTLVYMIILLPLQWTLVIDQNASLEEQFASVGGRLFFSTSDFLARRPVEDPLFFVALMSIAFWVISSWASFTLVRNQNYLGAILPAAIGLIIIQNYDSTVAGRLWFLAFFAFIALLLLGRMQLLQNKQSWRERRIFLSPDTGVDLTSSMAVAAGLIIMVAWTVPASLSSMNVAVKTWNRVTKPWHEFTESMKNAVSALESPGGNQNGEFFGSNLALGRGFPLSDLMMFEVETPDLPFEEKPPRYYWRGRTYDRFLKGQWYTSGTVREEYSPAVTNPFQVDMQEKTPAHFVFNTGKTNFSLLYSPAQPIWISRPGVTFALPADVGKDIVAWHAYPSLRGGETYQLDAILSNPNRQQLQEAGTAYPEWVRQKYLQLPQDFSPRIQELAREITVDAQTPYEKAALITRYLRENIVYSQTIPEPPRNKDSLEWVLFDFKQAYCVYYASAEVLMLRSVGVPARMAVGFAQGERQGNTYVVRRLNSHAWPEVYFPGIGWVEFEPTAGQAPLDRPLPPQDPLDASGLNLPNNLLPEEEREFASRDRTEEGVDLPSQQSTEDLLPMYLLSLLMIVAGLAIFLSLRYALPERVPSLLRTAIERTGIDVPAWVIRWDTWVKLSPIERAFESVNFALRNLDQAIPVHSTPVERATKLMRILPRKADEIKVLLDEHQTSLYTSRVADVTQARRAALSLRKQVVVERMRYLFIGKPSR